MANLCEMKESKDGEGEMERETREDYIDRGNENGWVCRWGNSCDMHYGGST